MRILVTGSDGFAGSVLTASLMRDGHYVRGFDLRAGDDLRDYEQVLSAVAGYEPDEVYHLAAVAHPPEAKADPRRAVAINVMGTANLLEAVRVSGCDCRVLVAGSSDEYGCAGREPGEVLTEASACRPDTPYGASKLAATSLAMSYASAFGLPVVACRPVMHVGPGKRATTAVSAFARRIVAAERGEADHVAHGDLSPLYDILDVADVVAAYRLAIRCEPGVYNVCRGYLVSLREVMYILLSLSPATTPDGHAVRLREDPRFGVRHAAPYPQMSAAKIEVATGWAPEVDLSDSLGGLLDWWRSR